LGKDNYVGMDYVGVRAQESLARSQYDYENFGKKQKGQYSHNPILEWSSAEVWLHIYSNSLPVNKAYKKGNSRAGCLFCPLGSGGKADWFRRACYAAEVEKYVTLIKETVSDKNIESYLTNGGWVERKNGRDIANNMPFYSEEISGGRLKITVLNPQTDWHEWIKTLGEFPFEIKVETLENGYTISVPESVNKSALSKNFKQVFHKAAKCVKCGICEANCSSGCLSFRNGFRINNCRHCGACHAINNGCLVYDSLRLPIEGRKKMSLNTFADHAPKSEWIRDFFAMPESFIEDNTLGPMQISRFKRFLSDSGIIKKNKPTDFCDKLMSLGWDSVRTWGLILVNIAHENPQVRWYVETLVPESAYSRIAVESMLTALSVSEKDAKSIVKAFARLCETPLGMTLGSGTVMEDGRQIDSIMRLTCRLMDDDRLVILYALYKYAEKCGGYYQFSLSRLMDDTIESEGLSPARIFGLPKEIMQTIINGLAARYPEFIEYTDTHGLDKISLREEKKSDDVLNLF
jgi:phosphoadenosine phosphosulfate reductase